MKKFLLLSVLVFSSVAANASYLYWQVLDAKEGAGTASAWANGWTSANLYVIETGKTEGGQSVGTAAAHLGTYPNGGTLEQKVDVSAYESGSYSFYIELVNSSATPTVVARSSDWKTYANLEEANMIVGTDLEQTHATWGGGSFVAAPEPTSAMLMLLGMAGLALRRKQRKLA